MADIPNRPEYQSDLFKRGLEVRRDVLGADYVDGSLTRADDFNAAFQQMTTEVAWGMIWTRPGLNRKTRSMINLTMLAALNRGAEFRLHLRAALTNGVTRDEIKEILLQIGAYCGIPACLEAFRIANNFVQQIGGDAPDTLRQLAAASDVVITMLPTSTIVERVLANGEDAVMA